MNNLNRRIKNVLYSLKRQYGGSFDLYLRGPGGSTNYKTGSVTVDKSVINIRHGIILPAKVIRETAKTLPVIGATRSFVSGTYDSSTRMFIVDRKDVPDLDLQDFDATEDDWIVYDNRKYEIKSFEEFEFDSAWVFTAKAVLGDTPEQIFNLCADNLIRVDQETIDV